MIMDMVARKPLPDRLRDNPSLYCGCISGAVEVKTIEKMLNVAGFRSIEIIFKDHKEVSDEGVKDDNVHRFVSSASIQAIKRKK